MEPEVRKLANSKIELLFEVEWQEILPYLDKAVLELGKNLNIPGFRPGNIPREIAEKELGETRILTEAAENLIKKKYSDYIVEKRLEVIGPPQVEILKLAPNNPLSFKVKVEIMPQVKLPDYKGITQKTEKREVSVKEEEISQALKFLQNSRIKFKDLAREARRGDFLEIKYQSPQIENGRIFQDKFFLAKGIFLPGFEENLIGANPGEKKEFSLTFPKDHQNQKLAGQEVKFKVEVEKVKEAEIPELNDNFAKSLGAFENLPALKKSVREGILKEKEIEAKQERRAEILEKIAKESELELPETLISLEKNHLMEDLKNKVDQSLKIPFEDYLKSVKKSEKEIEESFEEEAKKRVRGFLALKEIGKKENVEVTEEEIEKAANEFLKNFSDPEKTQELDSEKLKDYYKGVIYNEKVFEKLESFSK